jgi:hypothetical protein
MKPSHRFSLLGTALVALAPWTLATNVSAGADSPADFIRVSPRDPHYLELSDGRPYIPIGLNLIAPDGARGPGETNGLARMDEWMRQLAANGGNYIRIWLSSPFWDVEHERAGVYDEARARRVDQMLAMARRHGLRVKLTIEHFREMSDQPRQRWANKPLHLVANGGTATNMADFFNGGASRDQFRRKLEWFAKRYGDNPTIYGWELWNEINAVAAREEDYLPWSEVMLAELRRLFPRNLALQSLGSYDSARVRELYCRHSVLPGNDVAQVHRYLDLGASLGVCHGPVDVLTADAVGEILTCAPQRPVILAESGAVEPGHSGPFKLYQEDHAGILLHDVLFAPFFAGAAGAGQIWHWDSYVDRNHLWHHFARFATAVKDLDPPAERFQPAQLEHPRLRVYALKGERTLLLWCRDRQNTWQAELRNHQPPQTLTGLTLDLTELLSDRSFSSLRAYDPWTDRWSAVTMNGEIVALPSFSRSLILRLAKGG